MTKYSILLLFLVVITSITTYGNGQQIYKAVVSHLDSVVRDTKEVLGYPADVKGHAGYPTSDEGVNLTFALSGRELGSGINPYVKLAFQSKEITELKNFGITESDTGSAQPDWNQVFWFVWKKGTEQKWKIRVYDHNNDDKLIGEGVLDVDGYVDSGENAVVSLENGGGKILVKKTTPIKFKLSAKHLSRLDEFSSKSDPYVKVYFRRGIGGANVKFYTTSIIDNVVNADWDEVIEFPNYQRGTDQYLFFKVRDSDTITQDDHLGEVLVLVDQYVDLNGPDTIYLENSGENSSLTITPVPLPTSILKN